MKKIFFLMLVVFTIMGCDNPDTASMLETYTVLRSMAVWSCKQHAKSCTDGSILWLGDSNSCMMNMAEAFPEINICNGGVGGYTTYDIEQTYTDYMAVSHSKIFIMIGTNNLFRLGQLTDELLIAYRAMLERLKEFHLPIYCVSILPSTHEGHNKKVAAANAGIQTVCSEEGLTYIETVGYENSDFSVDGYHLNDTGREKFYAQIKPWLE